ncbi:hypothetical protein LQW54_010067 [Pestalotiopsis sp. IQ-011]
MAANSFRIPYWDWATDSNLPPATTWPEITVNTPDGEQTILNPLYSFTWPSFPLDHDPAWFPTTDDPGLWNSTGTQRDLNPSGNLALVVESLREKVYTVLARTKDFNSMATRSSPGPSLEEPHDDVHNAAGKFMANALYSAFDPIFWLHHANVDRLTAFWQAINYNTTYQTEAADIETGTWAQPNGTQMTADSPLAPFYQAGGGTFHTGKTMAKLDTFGYTYPEINDWALSPDRTRQIVIRQVNQLYGANHLTPSRGRRRQRKDESDPPTHPHRRGESEPGLRPQAEQRQYYVQIGVERSELDLPCNIQVLLGEDTVAGSAAIMALPPAGPTYAEIQLNRGIEQFTSCVEDKAVVALLEQSFRVEIRKANGTIIPADSVPSLTIDVESVDVRFPDADDEFPVYGPSTRYPKIGKPPGRYGTSGRRDGGGGLGVGSSIARIVNFVRARPL